jgi:peptidoglycan/xylan/chitin deacetylase (PgdA/CDA1 family)
MVSFRMKPILKTSILQAARCPGLALIFRKFFAGRAAILMFHEIQQDVCSQLMTGTSVSLFTYSLNWLQRKGWSIVSLDECLERLARDDRSRRYAVLTFDDGYRDNVEVALPILEQISAPFIVYVPTGAPTRSMQSWWLGLRQLFLSRDTVTIDPMGVHFRCPDPYNKTLALNEVTRWVHEDYQRAAMLAATFSKADISLSALNEAYFLDERELRILARHPLASIGGHTASHAALTSLDVPAARAEIADNRHYLENLLQLPVRHLAYPYGNSKSCGPREEQLAKEVGFSTAVTTHHGQIPDSKELNNFALPRIAVGGHCETRAAFEGRMNGIQSAVHMLRGQ